MAKQRGRELVLAVSTTDAGSTYETIGTLNSKTLTINNNSVDVTTPPSTPANTLWMESLDGVKSISVSGDGIFADNSQEARLNTIAMGTNATSNFRLTIPSFGTFTGQFRITSLEFGGETESGVTFSLSLESTGTITYATV